MINLGLGKYSILSPVQDFDTRLFMEGKIGFTAEITDDDLYFILDDENWSYFMSVKGAKFIGSNSESYYYEIGDKFLIIPIAEISEDECDIYLDVNNVEVVGTLDTESLDLV